MKVYQVQYDGEHVLVEAETFAEAVAIWRDDLLAEWTRDECREEGDEDVEPEAVVVMSERGVLRLNLAERLERDLGDPFRKLSETIEDASKEFADLGEES